MFEIDRIIIKPVPKSLRLLFIGYPFDTPVIIDIPAAHLPA
jgi:hypothetical protein